MKVGIVRYDRRGLSPDEQRKRLEEYGCESIWNVGLRDESIAAMLALKTLRSSSELVVCDLALLPDKGRGAGDKLTEHLVAILDTGARVTELISGHSYQGPSAGVRMIGDARTRLAKRTTGSTSKGGKPRKYQDGDLDFEWLALIWSRKDLPHNPARVKAAQAKYPDFRLHDYHRNREAIEAAVAKLPGKR